MPSVSKERIVSAVLDRFMEHGVPSTRREIAEALGVSLQSVSNQLLVDFPYGDLEACFVGVPVKSRDYPTLDSGRTRKVEAFYPSKGVLRSRVRELHRVISGLQDEIDDRDASIERLCREKHNITARP